MTNIVTAVRRVVSPVKTVERALGIFQTALDALDEVRDAQWKRRNANQVAINRNADSIAHLLDANDALHDDNANALLELDAADKATAAIRALIPA